MSAALEKIGIGRAEAIYAVTSTPLFLTQELRADPTIQRIAAGIDGGEILDALKRALRDKPASLHDLAKPYAYLAALSLKPNSSFLKEAATLEAPHFEWFAYLARALDSR